MVKLRCGKWEKNQVSAPEFKKNVLFLQTEKQRICLFQVIATDHPIVFDDDFWCKDFLQRCKKYYNVADSGFLYHVGYDWFMILAW